MVSWQTQAANLVLRLGTKRRLGRLERVGAHTVAATRRQLDALAAHIPEPPPGVRASAVNAGGVPSRWVEAPGADTARAVLFLHGGAYALGSPALYRDFTWRLSAAAGAPVLVPDYRLAPEHPFPAALDDALTAWHWLLRQGFNPARTAMAGDSAGGGLVLATLFRARERGAALPGTAACLSPWTDLTASGDSARMNAQRDPMLPPHLLRATAALYLGGADARDPLASPVFGDFSGLPPLALHVGSTEILLSDATRVAHRAEAAGVAVTLRVWERLPHIAHLLARYLPEGRALIAAVGAGIRAHTAPAFSAAR